jgi:hypothetical protein
MYSIYTPIKDTDVYTLFQLDDRDLYNACMVNKQTYQLCQHNPMLKRKLDIYLKRYNFNVIHKRNERPLVRPIYHSYNAYESSDEDDDINDRYIFNIHDRYKSSDKYKYSDSEEEVNALDFLDIDLNNYYNTGVNYTLPLRYVDEDYYDIDELPYKQRMTKQELDDELDEIAATIARTRI